jgi:hypothetical protein
MSCVYQVYIMHISSIYDDMYIYIYIHIWCIHRHSKYLGKYGFNFIYPHNFGTLPYFVQRIGEPK